MTTFITGANGFLGSYVATVLLEESEERLKVFIRAADERELTIHNLQEYVHLLAQLWLADGVHAQALAFRQGVEDVFSVAALEPFTRLELQTQLEQEQKKVEGMAAELQDVRAHSLRSACWSSAL